MWCLIMVVEEEGATFKKVGLKHPVKLVHSITRLAGSVLGKLLSTGPREDPPGAGDPPCLGGQEAKLILWSQLLYYLCWLQHLTHPSISGSLFLNLFILLTCRTLKWMKLGRKITRPNKCGLLRIMIMLMPPS